MKKSTRPLKKSQKNKSTRKHSRLAQEKLERNGSSEAKVLQVDIDTNPNDFFSKNASFDQHYDAQVKNRDKYMATAMAFDEFSIEILPNAKSRSLAAAFCRNDKELIDYYLNHNKNFGFVDVLKALIILDAKRNKRALETKIERISKTGSVMKAQNMTLLKNNIHNFEKIQPKVGSCSGALARKIKKWVQKYSQEDLEYFALNFPTAPWKKLADIVHLNPTKDFPNAPWFLPYCFGEELPKGSKVERCKNITNQNVNEIVAEFELPYSFLKNYKDNLNEKSKEKIANQEKKLDTLIWYYEDLACPEVNNVIKRRLECGEKVELGYGKLMERLIILKYPKEKSLLESVSIYSLMIPLAEKQLANFKSVIPSPVSVIGDASGSMSVAIKTATIISSLLTAICSAKLSFFKSDNFYSNKKPANIDEVLEVAYTTKAGGSTAPAASLVPYYDSKEIIKTFIMVTDEEENKRAQTNDGQSWTFYELFMEYRKTVFPASLIFVSFLASQHGRSQMYDKFVKNNVDDVQQFKFDKARPDLTKLDSILGIICSKSTQTFSGRVEEIESKLKKNSLIKTLENLEETIDQVNREVDDFVLVEDKI